MRNKDLLSQSSIEIAKHTSPIHTVLADIIRMEFPLPASSYVNMPLNDYRAQMLRAQEIISSKNLQREIVQSIKAPLISYMGTTDLMIQSNVYLRASRPKMPLGQENINWHREPFYGPNLEKSVNIWTPIAGVVKNNTLQFIPESQNIPSKNIETRNIGSRFTERFSTGHKLGFNYDEKEILSGVDLESAEPMIVPNGFSAIFSGNLIHGGAINNTGCIRFSVDFQLLRRRDFNHDTKKFHFSSGKEYFEELGWY